MSSYNIKNILHCENINEEVKQKYKFSLLPLYNGQVKVVLGENKCSGSDICKLKNISVECPILKKEKEKKIEEQKEMLLKIRKEEDKWNF